MDYYHIWCDLKPDESDLAFSDNLARYLGGLQAEGRIADYRLTRRKLGLAPDGFGEFHVVIETRDLAQLDAAFREVAARSGGTEARHAAVYRAVTNLRFALYRDFPDPERES
jgi:hypothetical protein